MGATSVQVTTAKCISLVIIAPHALHAGAAPPFARSVSAAERAGMASHSAPGGRPTGLLETMRDECKYLFGHKVEDEHFEAYFISR